jgi:hypothetical protein
MSDKAGTLGTLSAPLNVSASIDSENLLLRADSSLPRPKEETASNAFVTRIAVASHPEFVLDQRLIASRAARGIARRLRLQDTAPTYSYGA